MKRNRSKGEIVSFSTTPEEFALVRKIARRSVARGIHHRLVDAEMDVLAVHCNDCPLRLVELAEADAFNFTHDVAGIARHLDRQTGRLTKFFTPRYAQPEPAS